MSADSILGYFEAVSGPDLLVPFSRFSWAGRVCELLLPDAPGLAREPDAELRSALAFRRRLAASPEVRFEGQKLASELLARRLTRRVAGLGDDGLIARARRHRARFLQAVDRGRPLTAEAVRRMALDAPGCLGHLGHGLPGREAVELAGSFGPVLEFEAGFALFARALERRGVDVLAVDHRHDVNVGVCFPTAAGRQAERAWLALWPDLEEAWACRLAEAARPGQVLMLASPELAFAQAGGLVAEHSEGAVKRNALRLAGLLRRRFEEVGAAPLPTAWPGFAPVALRAYRRRAGGLRPVHGARGRQPRAA